jgi:hypothetical protein
MTQPAGEAISPREAEKRLNGADRLSVIDATLCREAAEA